MTAQADNLLTTGLGALSAGCSLIPIDRETKRPSFDLLPQVCAIPRQRDKEGHLLNSRGAVIPEEGADVGKGSWEYFQSHHPRPNEVERWVKAGAQLAIVGGAISGNIECIDLDVIEAAGESLHEAWREETGELSDGLTSQRTGGMGWQYAYRCPTAVEGNLKLAYLPDPEARSGERIAIETRGEGGYFVIAPSLHPSGNYYELLSGDWAHIPTIAPARRRALLDTARHLNQSERQKEQRARNAPDKASAYHASLNGQISVIDTFNATHTVEDRLERAGYIWRGRRLYLPDGGDEKRPGVVLIDGKSYHHDSDDPLSDGYKHTAFDVYCHFEHNDDLNAAVKAAAQKLSIPYEPHGAPVFDVKGRAACPLHNIQLRAGKKSGYYCPHPDTSTPSGFCNFWWSGEGYIPPIVESDDGAETRQALPDTAPIRKAARSEHILRTLAELGYAFRLNLCTDTIEINGHPMNDVLGATIRTQMRDLGIRPLAGVEDAYITDAAAHAYHPIRDYLTGLRWDGHQHIAHLASKFHTSDPPIVYADGSSMPAPTVYLARWLIGAVAKALDGHQNVMLVLAGAQNMGKSAFARWLCIGLPEGYFVEAPINVADKDSDVRLMSRFIWEVSELDATTRRADVSALKAFITRQTVTVRKAYGHYDTVKPALASFIGTVNVGAGFLADETGNRRFMVASLEHLDWAYTQIDIDQVWAEAVDLYRSGEPWQLLPDEAAYQAEQNKQYDADSTLEGWIEKHFLLTGEDSDRMTAADIVDHLRVRYDITLPGSERSQAMDISRVMAHLNVRKERTKRWRGYVGLSPKD